jgi:DNA replication and repair protein RecF
VQLNSLRVFNYRNFTEEMVLLSPGTNLFFGRNGQGKTNLLEAVYLLGYGKSFRTAAPKECIRHGEKECRVEGHMQHGALGRDLGVAISASEKKLFLHGKAVPIDQFVGNLHLLAFAGEHLAVVRAGPGDRRSFLDRAMVTIFPSHVRLLASYGRALKQRNKILSQASEGNSVDEAFLSSWEESLVQEGARITANRMRYVEMMKSELPEGLFGAENLKLKYLCASVREPAPAEDLIPLLRERIKQARPTDLRMGFTTVGPHRDELKLYVNGKSLADFGSAGQQRSALLSLYFAQMEIHRKNHGFYPLFLVDDVEAELDEQRLASFLTYLAERTQTFLTTAKQSWIPLIPGPIRKFEISAGTAQLDRSANS